MASGDQDLQIFLRGRGASAAGDHFAKGFKMHIFKQCLNRSKFVAVALCGWS